MIRFDSVAKAFKRVRVLDGISLEIGLGERVALIGSNGAGKTTLIRCLLGEYTHDGAVTIEGRSPRRDRTTVLGDIGAVTNRLDYTYNNIQVAVENYSASESVIRDADMAAEMVTFTKNQILLQAGTAMLAQANTSSQGILSLMS